MEKTSFPLSENKTIIIQNNDDAKIICDIELPDGIKISGIKIGIGGLTIDMKNYGGPEGIVNISTFDDDSDRITSFNDPDR